MIAPKQARPFMPACTYNAGSARVSNAYARIHIAGVAPAGSGNVSTAQKHNTYKPLFVTDTSTETIRAVAEFCRDISRYRAS